MPSLIVALEDKEAEMLERFPWVNWSELAREAANKRRIFEGFIKTRKLSSEDQKFCDDSDWHPVDELPLKEEYVRKLKSIEKGPHIPMTLDKLDKLLGIK